MSALSLILLSTLAGHPPSAVPRPLPVALVGQIRAAAGGPGGGARILLLTKDAEEFEPLRERIEGRLAVHSARGGYAPSGMYGAADRAAGCRSIAIVGNAGAFGGEMASVVTEVEVFDPPRCEVHTYANDECQFAYRSSRFKTGGAAAGYVLGATLHLRKEAAESILARMDAIRVRRKSNSPTGLSCGSVFKNPPGDFAGRIVETLGLKGTSIGGAEISSVHGNYIVNRERATAKDVCALIDLVRSRARDELGLELELEVRLVGFGDA